MLAFSVLTSSLLLGAMSLETAGIALPHQLRGSERTISQFGELIRPGGSDPEGLYFGHPAPQVAADATGDVFGTFWMVTWYNMSAGQVFELTPTAGAYRETIPFWFRKESGGSIPESGISAIRNGVLYGTTYSGGDPRGQAGVVYALTPDAGGYDESVLHTFKGGEDGKEPNAISLDSNGDVFGTTWWGGGVLPEGFGIAYELQKLGHAYVEKVLHRFAGTTGGTHPCYSLVADSSGALYGITCYGGEYDQGVAYKLTPDGRGGYSESVIHTFVGGNYDDIAAGAPIVGRNGMPIFAAGRGASGTGEVYGLRAHGGKYVKVVLHEFVARGDAKGPNSGLVEDAYGNLYGAAGGGGAYGFGAIYELSPQRGGFAESVLYSFRGQDDGECPYSLALGVDGNLYGVTFGGRLGGGTAFTVRL
jgi:uncharacterized repeat protein (TIGR03803 family)